MVETLVVLDPLADLARFEGVASAWQPRLMRSMPCCGIAA
jgi:hypothetical protein